MRRSEIEIVAVLVLLTAVRFAYVFSTVYPGWWSFLSFGGLVVAAYWVGRYFGARRKGPST